MISPEEIKQFQENFEKVRSEMHRVIVGYDEAIEDLLICLFAGGNILIESPPGLGKTLIVKTLSDALDLHFSRIQFTPDLMPSDILGTNVVLESEAGERYFEFQRGPVFTQVLLADEITRATPKTQSALLEAMQEHRVTVGGKTYTLEEPFFVLATQNPLDTEGTYSLPEAQLDRFFFKLTLDFPDLDTLQEIGRRTTTETDLTVNQMLNSEQVIEMKSLVRRVEADESMEDYAVHLVLSGHPESNESIDAARKFLRYGSSPRGVQALILGGKVEALVSGRDHVQKEDIAKIARPTLSHRLILNFEGEAEHLGTENIIEEMLAEVG